VSDVSPVPAAVAQHCNFLPDPKPNRAIEVNRRSFLLAATSLLLHQLLVACGGQTQATLKVRLLKSSIPAQLLDAFQKQTSRDLNLDFSAIAQIEEIYSQLRQWHQPVPPNRKKGLNLPFFGDRSPKTNIPDLVTLGDYWLSPAIREGLIRPLDASDLQGWSALSPQWQQLVKRNDRGELDPNGSVWAIPYRWGTTAIAYRADKFKTLGWTPTDWSDLWNPQLRDRLSLLDQPREVIGLTLKKLGHSYNTQSLNTLASLRDELQTLHAAVKFYSSDTYLQPLILGDTWIAVGWSTDIVPLTKRNRQIKAIIPSSGTALWADLWVRPADSAPVEASNSLALSPQVKQWLEFCWQPEIARKLSILSDAASPCLSTPEMLDPVLLENGDRTVQLPSPELFQKSEFLTPLPPQSLQEYLNLWQEIRRS
jgi:putative spermidine/putrescine transport system substrate-binding protein